jgi:hypothetical protein
MKKFLFCTALIALMLFPLAAHALDIEVGAGMAKYETRGDMMWYQEGLQHKLDLKAPAFEVGLADNFYQRGGFGLDWHAGYVYLGNVHSDAYATADQNYSRFTKSCIGACWYKNRFVGNGHSQGIKLTLEPNYTYMGWRVGFEAGLFAYVRTWDVNVYTEQGQTLNTTSDRKVRVAPVVGFNVGRGGFSVALLHYFNKTYGDPMYSLWSSTTTVTLRYRF